MRHWYPSLHTFFFFVGELTITLEDVVNNYLLLMSSDENPFDISLSMNLSREKDKAVRQAGFLTLWLSTFFFNEFPRYGIKFVLFPLVIRLAWGAQYLLASMFLGYVYSQLDLLHEDEVEGNSCYTITSSLHCAILQVFMWDRSSVTLSKCRNLKYVKDKF